jgi:hypothetical protein
MRTLFISCQDIDGDQAQRLIQTLMQNGFTIVHSPRNPLRGHDQRWDDWYSRGLPAAISKASAFIIVIDQGWDSSSWMATESDEALRASLPMYVYNPMELRVVAKGMLGCLGEILPTDADRAAAYLKKANS